MAARIVAEGPADLVAMRPVSEETRPRAPAPMVGTAKAPRAAPVTPYGRADMRAPRWPPRAYARATRSLVRAPVAMAGGGATPCARRRSGRVVAPHPFDRAGSR